MEVQAGANGDAGGVLMKMQAERYWRMWCPI